MSMWNLMRSVDQYNRGMAQPNPIEQYLSRPVDNFVDGGSNWMSNPVLPDPSGPGRGAGPGVSNMWTNPFEGVFQDTRWRGGYDGRLGPPQQYDPGFTQGPQPRPMPPTQPTDWLSEIQQKFGPTGAPEIQPPASGIPVTPVPNQNGTMMPTMQDANGDGIDDRMNQLKQQQIQAKYEQDMQNHQLSVQQQQWKRMQEAYKQQMMQRQQMQQQAQVGPPPTALSNWNGLQNTRQNLLGQNTTMMDNPFNQVYAQKLQGKPTMGSGSTAAFQRTPSMPTGSLGPSLSASQPQLDKTFSTRG